MEKKILKFYGLIFIRPLKKNIYLTLFYKNKIFITNIGKSELKKPKKPLALVFEFFFSKLIYYSKN